MAGCVAHLCLSFIDFTTERRNSVRAVRHRCCSDRPSNLGRHRVVRHWLGRPNPTHRCLLFGDQLPTNGLPRRNVGTILLLLAYTHLVGSFVVADGARCSKLLHHSGHRRMQADDLLCTS